MSEILVFNPVKPRSDGGYDGFGVLGSVAEVAERLEGLFPGLRVVERSWGIEGRIEDPETEATILFSLGRRAEAADAPVDSLVVEVRGDFDGVFPFVRALNQAFGWHAKTFDEGRWLTPLG